MDTTATPTPTAHDVTVALSNGLKTVTALGVKNGVNPKENHICKLAQDGMLSSFNSYFTAGAAHAIDGIQRSEQTLRDYFDNLNAPKERLVIKPSTLLSKEVKEEVMQPGYNPNLEKLKKFFDGASCDFVYAHYRQVDGGKFQIGAGVVSTQNTNMVITYLSKHDAVLQFEQSKSAFVAGYFIEDVADLQVDVSFNKVVISTPAFGEMVFSAVMNR